MPHTPLLRASGEDFVLATPAKQSVAQGGPLARDNMQFLEALSSTNATRFVLHRLWLLPLRLQEELQALSNEIADLNDAHNDMQRSTAIDKESVDGGLRETRKDLRTSGSTSGNVDTVLRAKFPNSSNSPAQASRSESTRARPTVVVDYSGTETGSGIGLGLGAASSRMLPPTSSQEPPRYSTAFSRQTMQPHCT